MDFLISCDMCFVKLMPKYFTLEGANINDIASLDEMIPIIPKSVNLLSLNFIVFLLIFSDFLC